MLDTNNLDEVFSTCGIWEGLKERNRKGEIMK